MNESNESGQLVPNKLKCFIKSNYDFLYPHIHPTFLPQDMTSSNNNLSYISAQYCATETPADPSTEPRECQRQAKRQEDVLKK